MSEKKTIFLVVSCLLAVVACAGPSPQPELISVGKTGPVDVRTYADRATIQKRGTIVWMSSVLDLDGGRLSWRDEWGYECRDKTLKPNRFTEYSGRMGTGEEIYSQVEGSFYWMPVVPGSVGEKLWQIACGKE